MKPRLHGIGSSYWQHERRSHVIIHRHHDGHDNMRADWQERVAAEGALLIKGRRLLLDVALGLGIGLALGAFWHLLR